MANPGDQRIIVTCDQCDHVQRLERPTHEPETRYLICHGCEAVLAVEVTAETLGRAVPWYRRVLT